MAPKTDQGRKYHETATGDALPTVQLHEKDAPITLFGSCFCPFGQRVWAALEFYGIEYKYYEIDPYKKPADLLEVSPKGLVPGLRLNRDPPRALNESTVILEYLEDLAATTTKKSLLPSQDTPYARALTRLTADHVSRALVPAFYRFLQAQEEDKQIEYGKAYHVELEELGRLLERIEQEGEPEAKGRLGLWEPNSDFGWVDTMVGPWLFRPTNVLAHYRAFTLPDSVKFRAYVERLFAHPAFKGTCSDEKLYLDSYERYAFNRPNTSQVANAINEGKGLP